MMIIGCVLIAIAYIFETWFPYSCVIGAIGGYMFGWYLADLIRYIARRNKS